MKKFVISVRVCRFFLRFWTVERCDLLIFLYGRTLSTDYSTRHFKGSYLTSPVLSYCRHATPLEPEPSFLDFARHALGSTGLSTEN